MSKSVASLTPKEILDELTSGSLLCTVRQEIFGSANRIEQINLQQRRPTALEVRRMELAAAERVIWLVKEWRDADA